ncbi:MAG: dihydrofolate reductase [Patescibacteria group bacterium]
MIISIIAALGNNRIIGNGNSLPWDLPADMNHFRELTLGKPIIMGQKTFESIGKALPKRHNIVLTRDKELSIAGCDMAYSLDHAIELAEKSEMGQKSGEVMICGGASIYSQYLSRAEKMYLTFIEGDFKGDIFFPEFNYEDWKEIERVLHKSDECNKYNYSFVIFERKKVILGEQH